jgi:hypothetical protein
MAEPHAAIVNSGSTNRPGYRIEVRESGEAQYRATRGGKTGHLKIPNELAQKFFADLAAQPLANLPPRHCAKSASFGTVLTVEWGGEKSPDLNCGDGGDVRLRALIEDARAIVKLFDD